ncbi:hypothetical protein [Acinetobacter sp. TR3]|uniref:hypothetical protein n=1 Tax=Acinetobacter sp. TR3 TaxID=3003392 RepID=UPI0022ABCEC4|nr:hypothetical protein [Acinetobacter sp. TR3]WAU76340.1 hypothetical protein O1449_13920 [Acinetobacter sp. TR3]
MAMHTINTFLFPSRPYSREEIFDKVREYCGKWPNVRFSEDWKPFGVPADLRIAIDDYFILVGYIDDPSVVESVEYVQKVVGRTFPIDLLAGEVRTTFADDPNSDFDDFAICMYQFLETLPGAVVYDDNHKDIFTSKV